MVNQPQFLPEPTRYRVVVLTSWERTYRNPAGQPHQHRISSNYFTRTVTERLASWPVCFDGGASFVNVAERE